MKNYAISVRGRVQGVGFRLFVLSEGRRRGLNGWVRNEADGSVTIHLEIKEGELKDFLSALSRGNGASRVERVETQSLSQGVGVSGFEIQ